MPIPRMVPKANHPGISHQDVTLIRLALPLASILTYVYPDDGVRGVTFTFPRLARQLRDRYTTEDRVRFNRRPRFQNEQTLSSAWSKV